MATDMQIVPYKPIPIVVMLLNLLRSQPVSQPVPPVRRSPRQILLKWSSQPVPRPPRQILLNWRCNKLSTLGRKRLIDLLLTFEPSRFHSARCFSDDSTTTLVRLVCFGLCLEAACIVPTYNWQVCKDYFLMRYSRSRLLKSFHWNRAGPDWANHGPCRLLMMGLGPDFHYDGMAVQVNHRMRIIVTLNVPIHVRSSIESNYSPSEATIKIRRRGGDDGVVDKPVAAEVRNSMANFNGSWSCATQRGWHYAELP